MYVFFNSSIPGYILVKLFSERPLFLKNTVSLIPRLFRQLALIIGDYAVRRRLRSFAFRKAYLCLCRLLELVIQNTVQVWAEPTETRIRKDTARYGHV